MLAVKTAEETVIQVDAEHLKFSKTINDMLGEIKDHSKTLPITLARVTVDILKYCTDWTIGHSKGWDEKRLEEFDTKFVNMSVTNLVRTLEAANYLEIPGMFDLFARAVADLIRGKDTHQIRTIFGIVKDFVGDFPTLPPEEVEEASTSKSSSKKPSTSSSSSIKKTDSKKKK